MHSIDNEHIVRLYGVVLEADALMLVNNCYHIIDIFDIIVNFKLYITVINR